MHPSVAANSIHSFPFVPILPVKIMYWGPEAWAVVGYAVRFKGADSGETESDL